MSIRFNSMDCKSFSPKSSLSSAPSTACIKASFPPAIMPITSFGSDPNVGGHSTASSKPSLPLVPAPMYIRRQPDLNEATILLTASIICGIFSRSEEHTSELQSRADHVVGHL